jgi:hypothetical protein
MYGFYLPLLFSIFAAINELGRSQISDLPRENTLINLPRYFTTAILIIALTLVYNIWVIMTAS